MLLKNEPNALWKICIPSQQLEDLVTWFHRVLNHCGFHRLLTTINMHLYYLRLCRVASRVNLKNYLAHNMHTYLPVKQLCFPGRSCSQPYWPLDGKGSSRIL
jgi:hypothetical protein